MTPVATMQQSPFENIFNIIGGLSQGNEKPMKHGFYNAFALFVLAACCAALYALFLILEPFFKPLFWALLVGSLLHPFKYRLSKQLKAWFDGLEKSNTSVMFGIVVIPVNLVNSASNTIGSQFKEHYKLVLGLLFAVLVLPWAYGAVPRALICMFWQCTNFFSVSVRLFVSVFNSYIMLTVALGYLVCVYTLWSPERAPLFRKASLLLWLCASSYLAGLAGAFQVGVFMLLQLLALAGFFVEVLDIHNRLSEKDAETSIFTSINIALQNTCDQFDDENVSTQGDSENTPKAFEGPPETPKTTATTDSPSSTDKEVIAKRRGLYKTHTLSTLPLSPASYQYQNVEALRKLRKSLNETEMRSERTEENEDETALYFKLLFFGCICVLIWKQMWLLPVTLFFLCVYFIKNVGHFFGVWVFIEEYYDAAASVVTDWWRERSGAVVPAHVRGVVKLAAACNGRVRAAAYGSVDTVSSCIVITALILFLISASVFLCIQIYSEALVVVQLSSSVLNSSAVRDSRLWGYLPDGWEDSMDSLFDNAYTYGREGISKIVRGVLQEGEAEKVARVEQQVLELWDRVYQSWMAGGFQSVGPQVDGGAVQESWDDFLSNITTTPGLFNYPSMVEWVQANVGTLTAIAGGVWAPLASNVSLLAGSLAAFASVLLCGGTAILNFIFSSVVFFTTLFYLLASSGALYKPVEVITQTQPSFGPRLGLALSVAINQVFRASFKMALFYGLWTWLVHNLFGAKVVYLPSAVEETMPVAFCMSTLGAMFQYLLFISLALTVCGGVITRVYFTGCRSPGWACSGTDPNVVEYSCRSADQHDIITHIKDFYTSLITSVTIKDCKSVKIYLDCPQLVVPARLQHFAVKDTEKLEFLTLSDSSSKQTPMNFTIENVKDIPSLPTGTFKSPSTGLERKCFGNFLALQSIVIRNSKIGTVDYHALHNVTNIKIIQLENVNITNLNDHAIEADMDAENSEFLIDNIKIDNIQTSSITIQSTKFSFRSSSLEVLPPYGLNVSSVHIDFVNNTVLEVMENGLYFSASATNITGNTFKKLRSGALQGSKCVRRRTTAKSFNFSNNTIVNVDPSSLSFDCGTCRSLRAQVTVRNNRMDCRCQHISWLTSSDLTDPNEMFLNRENNNTCYPAPCLLPVEVVRTLQSGGLCHLNLAPQVMCYVYYDRRAGHVESNDVDDDGATEAAAAFYMIRQARGRAPANLIDREAILNDNRLNMTNRTTLNMVFDSTKDFEESLRNTSSSQRRGNLSVASLAPQRGPPAARCAGAVCSSSVADNKRKALDFYKYLYAQLHSEKT